MKRVIFKIFKIFDFGKTYQFQSEKSVRKEITTHFWLNMQCSTTALHFQRKSSLIYGLNKDFPICNIWKRRLGNLKNFRLVEKQNHISLSDKLSVRKLFFDVGWTDWSVSNGITSKIKSRKIAHVLKNRWHHWWKCEAYVENFYSARLFSHEECEQQELFDVFDVLLSDRKQNAWTYTKFHLQWKNNGLSRILATGDQLHPLNR
jgi:hypothetical protein